MKKNVLLKGNPNDPDLQYCLRKLKSVISRPYDLVATFSSSSLGFSYLDFEGRCRLGNYDVSFVAKFELQKFSRALVFLRVLDF